MIEAVDSADAGTSLATAERIEAVIISGSRRGEIIRLPATEVPEVSEEDLKLLNDALDQVLAAIDRLEAEVQTSIEVFSAPSRLD